MSLNHIQTILIGMIMLIVFLIIYFMVRNMMAYQRKKAERDGQDTTQVGFVVDTFHELVAKLKENERELEDLKKRAEDRASSVEIYNEHIFQSVSSGMVSFDQGLLVTRMNAAALKMFAMAEHDVIGRPYDTVFQEPLRGMIAARAVVERAEAPYTNCAGKRLWLGLSLSPLRDSDGAVIGQLLVFTDLSELKAFQSQRELRDRLATLGEMSAGIAHELRNPMAVISGYTKILMKKVEGPQRPAVEAIGREVEVMDRIITDFLSFARPAEPVLARLDLRELISECIGTAVEQSSAVHVELEGGHLPQVRADDVLMRQAFTNLIRNAVEAMPDGGDLRISLAADDQVVIRVSDTGHGIPGSIRDKIFLPFYTTKERGTGLGLAIVHKIIASHGGSISVDSSDRGTVFTVRLPKDRAA